MQYSKEEKQQHLDGWRKSGLTQSAYCRENGLNLATFHYWKMRADKAAQPAGNVFIPAKIVNPSGTVLVNMPGGLSVSCQLAQLPQVIRALQAC